MKKSRWVGKSALWPLNMVRSLLSLVFSLLLGGVLLGALGLGIYMLYLDSVIRAEFDQKRWAMPARLCSPARTV